MDSRVVVITGASSGIGQSIARRFAIPGDYVVVHGHRNLEGLSQSAEHILAAGSQTRAILADLSDQHATRQLVEAAFAWRKRVDVWINAHGADVLTGSASKLSFDEKLERLWRTDVLGSIRISRGVAERMLLQTPTATLPTILNLSWDQAESGMEGDSGQFFSATKAAIAAFSKSLARTVGPKIRVNCIAPGWIQTSWGASAPEIWDRRARGESMLDRWGRPSDIANVAWMLASPECEFINGQTIPVNGGWKPAPHQ